jgi:hypothetical protein
MDLRYIRSLVDQLDAQGIVFEPGLSDDEVQQIEARFHFRFPPDLRKFLQYALPRGERFPGWRKGASAALRESLAWPSQGILDDVQHHDFWLPAWGDQPPSPEQATETVRALLDAAPMMVPVFGHRYMPCSPHQAGNPVFSIVGTEIMYAGSDLPSFFTIEFGVPCPAWAASAPRPIPFWDDLIA